MPPELHQTNRGGEVDAKHGTNTLPDTEQIKSHQERESELEMNEISSGAKNVALYVSTRP